MGQTPRYAHRKKCPSPPLPLPHMTALRARVALLRSAAPDEKGRSALGAGIAPGLKESHHLFSNSLFHR